MAIGLGESTSTNPPNPSDHPINNNNNNVDSGNFECNICYDWAQDPIITLCGHLFCWPCLYRWLHLHSRSHECPVCKALIEEEKLVPIYGRGKNSTDPRSKPIPGMEIPHRPTGQRPETAPPPRDPHADAFGGVTHVRISGLGRFILTTLLRLIPSISITLVHGSDGHSIRYGYLNVFHGRPAAHGFTRDEERQRLDSNLKWLLLVIGFCVLLSLIWN